VRLWVHGGHLRQSGQKISKSTGNVVRVHELVERGIDPLAFRWLTFSTRYRSEMDFTWDAMEDADRRVKQLRRRMVEWGPAATELTATSAGFDRRFREAVADDLDMPSAAKVVNELVASDQVTDNEKYALLVAWDQVLGLDLEREARAGWEPTDEMRALMAERDAARDAKDYARADELRDRLADMGLEVMDAAAGTTVRPRD
jgi:cysteinyl-tRNA synthetase